MPADAEPSAAKPRPQAKVKLVPAKTGVAGNVVMVILVLAIVGASAGLGYFYFSQSPVDRERMDQLLQLKQLVEEAKRACIEADVKLVPETVAEARRLLEVAAVNLHSVTVGLENLPKSAGEDSHAAAEAEVRQFLRETQERLAALQARANGVQTAE